MLLNKDVYKRQLDVFERTLLQHNIKLSSLNVLMYLGSTESIKLFLENTDCMGIVSVRSIYKELAAGTFRVIEILSLIHIFLRMFITLFLFLLECFKQKGTRSVLLILYICRNIFELSFIRFRAFYLSLLQSTDF